MAINLSEQFISEFGNDIIRHYSSLLGESSQNVSIAIESATPAIVGFLISKSKTPTDVKQMLEFISVNGIDHLNINTVGQGILIDKGSLALSFLTGSDQAIFTDSISMAGNLKTSSANTLLKIISPLLLASVYHINNERSFSASSLCEFLKSQLPFVEEKAPQQIKHMLENMTPHSTSDDTNKADVENTSYIQPAGMSKMLPWIILLLFSLGLFYLLEKGCGTKSSNDSMQPSELRDTI